MSAADHCGRHQASAKLYWNNYKQNPATHYATGQVINVDFAVSEDWPLQAGIAGFYAFQTGRLMMACRPGDGCRGEVRARVLAYDMPEQLASMNQGVEDHHHRNGCRRGVALTVVKKLW
jgi:hypothetical protein